MRIYPELKRLQVAPLSMGTVAPCALDVLGLAPLLLPQLPELFTAAGSGGFTAPPVSGDEDLITRGRASSLPLLQFLSSAHFQLN